VPAVFLSLPVIMLAHEQQWNKNERYGNISQSGQVSTFYVNLK
jgi:hypothetical protein